MSKMIAPNTVAFLCGILFSLGLGIGGMLEPFKVEGFLDFFGDWDPTLVFVMAGAVVTYGTCFQLIKRRHQPILSERFMLPLTLKVDGKLIAGSALFGMGWGLAGFCPGPALVTVVTGNMGSAIFVIAMLAGMLLSRVLEPYSTSLIRKG